MVNSNFQIKVFRKAGIRITALALLSVVYACLSVNHAYAEAQQYASKPRQTAAIGHYARARAMMVEALAEFEQGRKAARPDLLIDSEEFRLRLISLTEELNRVIDPKPRVSRDGVVFRGNPRMIRREQERLPVVSDGARAGNEYGDTSRLRNAQESRKRMYDQAAQTEAQIGINKEEATEAVDGKEYLPESEVPSSRQIENVSDEVDEIIATTEAAKKASDNNLPSAADKNGMASEEAVTSSISVEEAVDESEKFIDKSLDNASVSEQAKETEEAKSVVSEFEMEKNRPTLEESGQQSEVDKTTEAIEKSVEERLKSLGEKSSEDSLGQ